MNPPTLEPEATNEPLPSSGSADREAAILELAIHAPAHFPKEAFWLFARTLEPDEADDVRALAACDPETAAEWVCKASAFDLPAPPDEDPDFSLRRNLAFPDALDQAVALSMGSRSTRQLPDPERPPASAWVLAPLAIAILAPFSAPATVLALGFLAVAFPSALILAGLSLPAAAAMALIAVQVERIGRQTSFGNGLDGAFRLTQATLVLAASMAAFDIIPPSAAATALAAATLALSFASARLHGAWVRTAPALAAAALRRIGRNLRRGKAPPLPPASFQTNAERFEALVAASRKARADLLRNELHEATAPPPSEGRRSTL